MNLFPAELVDAQAYDVEVGPSPRRVDGDFRLGLGGRGGRRRVSGAGGRALGLATASHLCGQSGGRRRREGEVRRRAVPQPVVATAPPRVDLGRRQDLLVSVDAARRQRRRYRRRTHFDSPPSPTT